MNGLRKQSLSVLSRVQFEPAPAEHELVTIDSAAGAQPHRRPLALSDILRLFGTDAVVSPPPVLRLVKLHIRHSPVDRILEAPTLNASRDDVLALWDLFNLDPTVLQLIATGLRGINQFHPATWNEDTESFHFMFSSYLYSVIWTYRPRTQSTSGVIIARPKATHNIRTDLKPWWEALQMQIGVIKHPLCLFIVTAMQSQHARTHGSLDCQGRISHIERMTGFSPWSHETHDSKTSPGPTSVGLDELNLASRAIGAVSVSLEDHVRQLRSLRKAAESYMHASFVNISSIKESSDVLLAMQVLSQHMDAWEIRLDYLQGRAKKPADSVIQPHSPLRCRLQHSNRTLSEKRQRLYEGHCHYDDGVPPSHFPRRPFCRSLTSMGLESCDTR